MKAQKLAAFILVIAMLFSFASVSTAAEDDSVEPNTSVVLTDISPATVEGRAVTKLVSLGIINGYEDGTYRPAQNITRAEFCVVMTKFVGMDSVIYKDALTGFDDLDTDENYAWARPYVKMAVDRGIITGFEDGTFRAKDQVTYEQAIKMIVCALRYDKLALDKMTEGDWSSGYMRQAQDLRITLNAPINNKKDFVSRGTVAILLNNALDVEPLNEVTGKPEGSITGADTWQEQIGKKEVRGIVTGTYVTELESGASSVPRDHIQIGTDIYEVGFTQNPNDFLGCRVRATITSESENGDYPVCESLEVISSNLLTIEASCIESYDTGTLKYVRSKNDTAVRTANLDDDIITIYNGKYYDYDLNGIKDNLKVGNIELIDNDGDSGYDVARINSYDIYVIDSVSRNSQTIKVMYDAGDAGTVTFPDSSTSLIFSLRMSGGDEMEISSLRKWDVLNVRQTPEDVQGRRYYEAVVTRKTVSGKITGRDESDKTYIEIDGKEYYMSEEFANYESDDKPSLEAGGNAQVYLDAEGRVVAAAEAKSSNTSEEYAYLLGLRQESDKSEYDLEFWIYTTKGEKLQIGSADRITINGTGYKATNKEILDILERSAQMANSAYAATGYVENVVYHQPIIYQKNSSGLISVIHTVLSEENDDISMVMDGGDNYVPGGELRTYRSSSRSFTDFKVSSSTDIIFVPDDRGKTDDYLTFSSYSSAFTNSREYYVEAYGLSSSDTASLVLLYHQNDSRIYTSASYFMIVSGKSQTLKDGTNITGYSAKGGGTISTSETTVTVSEEDGPDISSIGRGDIIRYILNTDRELIDYEIWFDASDPVQMEPCSSVSEALDKRILAIHSTSVDPREGDYPSATFRLQYGTVTELVLEDENDDDDDDIEETITVAPTIVEDGMGMVYDGDGVVTRTIGSSVRVFYYDRSGRNSTVEKDAELSEILPYVDYGESATRVITYSTSGTLRMVYIIAG